MEATEGRLEVLFGTDELLLPALSLGAVGAVGSTFNYLAPLFLKLWLAWKADDHQQALELQCSANRIIEVLLRWDNALSSGKAALEILKFACGDPRPPLRRFSPEEKERLKAELEAVSFPSSLLPLAAG